MRYRGNGVGHAATREATKNFVDDRDMTDKKMQEKRPKFQPTRVNAVDEDTTIEDEVEIDEEFNESEAEQGGGGCSDHEGGEKEDAGAGDLEGSEDTEDDEEEEEDSDELEGEEGWDIFDNPLLAAL